MRNMAVVAVASSTAPGVWETSIPRAVEEGRSIWSYPAPLWQMYLTEEGRALMISGSNTPIELAESLCLKGVQVESAEDGERTCRGRED
jgi:hypothetical protein